MNYRSEEFKSTLTQDEWRVLSPHLDEALEMTGEQRAVWLASLRERQPLLAGQLEALLKEHENLRAEGFLENRPVELPGSAGLSGAIVGAYTLISEIGQGGMGSVWLAERHDGRFARQVAVKFLKFALVGVGGEARFKREGRILGSLAHPHIAELLDAGVTASGQPYLVLEYVEGKRIDQYCDEHNLGLKARIRLFLNVLTAVAHAHANLIVHRDLKPLNVLVRDDGQVKLLDFGIAKLLADEAEIGETNFLTVTGMQPMTPEYAAPEQLLGRSVTTATDVYALGVLLYVLLTGQHPAGTELRSPVDLVRAVVDREPARPSDAVLHAATASANVATNAGHRASTPEKLRRVLRGDLDTIVAKCLKKAPAERYASVGALADDLRRYLGNEPIAARPDTIAYRTAKFVRRNRVAVALTALAVFATGGGLIAALLEARAARSQRDFALRQVERSEALNEFHEFLLSDAAPSGKPFTVNELLKRAEHVVELQHAPNDPNRVRLMVSIGRQYLEQDEQNSSRRVLEAAYKLSLPLTDVAVRAAASCALAASLAREDELPRAEKLFQEGLRELPQGPQFALERMNCLQSGSEIVQQTGDIREGIARAEAAQRVLRQSPFDSAALELSRWADLGKVYGSAARDADAVAAYEHAGALLSSLGRQDTGTAVALFNNWAFQLHQMGRPLEAEKLYRRAIDTSKVGQSEEAVSPVVLCNYARCLRELGRLDEAADCAERAYSKALQVGLTVNQVLLERARIATARHNPARAAILIAEVEPRLRQGLPAGHYAFAVLASLQALNALEAGDAARAMTFADRAVFLDEVAIRTGGEGSYHLPSLLVCRSTVELALQRAEPARTDAARAVNLLQPGIKPGTFSSTLGHAFLALGQAERARGHEAEARTAFRSAAQQLESTLGPDHPDTLLAGQFAQ